MTMIPLLNVDFLEEEQIIYECQLRNLQYNPLTQAIIDKLKKRITDYVGNPIQLVHVNSPEGQDQELIRCVAGIKTIITRYSSISLSQRLHRTIHFYYRLKRLTEVSNTARQKRYIIRAFEMIKIFQSAHPRDPLPDQFMEWARAANITTESEREMETGSSELQSTKIDEPPINTRSGTKPKVRQPTTQVTSPSHHDTEFRLPSDMHSTLQEQSSVGNLAKSIREMRERQDRINERIHEQNSQRERQLNERLDEFQKSILDALRTAQPVQTRVPQPVTQPQFVPQPSDNYNSPRQTNQMPMPHMNTMVQHNIPQTSQASHMPQVLPSNSGSQFNYPLPKYKPMRNEAGNNLPPNAQPLHYPFENRNNVNHVHAPNAYMNQTNFNRPANNFSQFQNGNLTQADIPGGYGQSSENGRESVLLAKLQQLPRWNCRFSGIAYDTKNQSLNEYIASIRNFMRTVDLSSRDMMRHIYPTLRDDAQRFYLSLPNNEISLEEFFDKLRNRFGDKRGAASAILDLSRNKFDDRRSIHGHIDDMVFRMQMMPYNWSETEQLAIIRQTLPENYLKPIICARISTIDDLKEFCHEAFPVHSSWRRRSEPKGKVMSLELVSDDEDSEQDAEDEVIDCSVVRKFDKKPNFKRNDRNKFHPSLQNKRPMKSDEKRITSGEELFCGNCLTLGHAAKTCTEPKRIYCYHCGAVGVTVNSCESESCRNSKNE